MAVTVYQGQALVTREVSVPEGDGTVELVVTPLPPQTVDSSLYTEGADGLRVLSTRFRTRAVKDDTRQEVRAKEELLKKLEADAQRLQKEIAVQEQDLKYLQKLEGFTGTALTGLTEKGRLDSEAILTLSKFVMESRGAKTKTETDLRQQLQANAEAAEFAKRQLAELSAGSSRVERDAVIVVQQVPPRGGHGPARLPRRRRELVAPVSPPRRGRRRPGPARISRRRGPADRRGLAGRPRHALHRPTSLDAAPPELLPLKMAVAGAADSGPIEAHDDRSQQDRRRTRQSDRHVVPERDPAGGCHQVRPKRPPVSPAFPEGIPIYVDPIGLQDAEKTMTSTVIDRSPWQSRSGRRSTLLLKQLGLVYQVKDGLLTITSNESVG